MEKAVPGTGGDESNGLVEKRWIPSTSDDESNGLVMAIHQQPDDAQHQQIQHAWIPHGDLRSSRHQRTPEEDSFQ